MTHYYESQPFGKGEDGLTPLHNAVITNELQKVQNEIICLKEQNLSLDSRTKYGRTSLQFACNLPVDTSIAKLLIEEGANVNNRDVDEHTPLHSACHSGKPDVVEALLAAGADVNAYLSAEFYESSETPLRYLASGNESVESLKIVKLLLEAGAEVNKYNKEANGGVFMTHDLSHTLDYRETKYNILINGPAIALALKANNVKILKMLWSAADIQTFNESFTSLYYYLIEWSWDPNESDRVECFFEVMNTPGVKLHPDVRYFHKLAITLVEVDVAYPFGISEFTIDDFYMVSYGSNYFYKVDAAFANKTEDVYGITKKLLEKGAVFLKKDLEGFIYICSYYHRFKYLDRQIQLLNLLVESFVNITPYVIYFSVVNHPDFTLSLLQYCVQCDPVDIFNHFLKSKRKYDTPFCNLIKNVLKLCWPNKQFRDQCCYQINKEYPDCPTRDTIYDDGNQNLEIPLFMLTPSKYERNQEMLDEIIDLLHEDRVPTLVELSRDKIRLQLRMHCQDTSTYLQSLESLKLSNIFRNIIQCKQNVNLL